MIREVYKVFKGMKFENHIFPKFFTSFGQP